jgi:iron uptake system component EfeO
VIRVTATPEGCQPSPARVPAGPIEVVATNLDAPTVSEVEVRTSDLSQVLGEKENLIEGMTAQFSAYLARGRYIVNCPGATEPHWLLVATSAHQHHTS